MNKDKFSEAMNQIDDRFYEEANNYAPQKKNHSWVKWCVAAACAVVVCSGTVVLAAGFPFVDKVADTLLNRNNKWRGTEYTEATPEQKELFAQYSKPLDIDVELECGRLHLDGICYDTSNIFIAYRLYPDIEGLQPGDPVNRQPLRDQLPKYRIKREAEAWLAEYPGMTHDPNECWLGGNWYLDSTVQEDGSLEGYILYSADWTNDPIVQGDVIQCGLKIPPTKRLIEEGEDTSGLYLMQQVNSGKLYEYTYNPPVILCEITLDQEINQLALATDTLDLHETVTVTDFSLTSLSLRMTGGFFIPEDMSGDKYQVDRELGTLLNNATIVMKDGSTVTGSGGGRMSQTDRIGSFNFHILFDQPINLDDVEWVHLDGSDIPDFEGIDLWIPAHAE